jgi:hypothetical protein
MSDACATLVYLITKLGTNGKAEHDQSLALIWHLALCRHESCDLTVAGIAGFAGIDLAPSDPETLKYAINRISPFFLRAIIKQNPQSRQYPQVGDGGRS